MDKLFDSKPKVLGIVASITLLVLGYIGLMKGLPFYNLYLMTAGIVGTILVWGVSGLKNLFSPLRKGAAKYIILGFIWNIVQSFSIALFFQYVIGVNFKDNPAAEIFQGNAIMEFIKNMYLIITSLMGEELIVLLPVCIGVYYLKQKGKLSNSHAMIIATIVSTIIFAAMHYETYDKNMLQIAIIGLARLPFNWVAFKSKSITASIITHCVYDIFSFILALS